MPRKEEACPEMQRQEQKSFSCRTQKKPVPWEGRSLNSNPRSWPQKSSAVSPRQRQQGWRQMLGRDAARRSSISSPALPCHHAEGLRALPHRFPLKSRILSLNITSVSGRRKVNISPSLFLVQLLIYKSELAAEPPL